MTKHHKQEFRRFLESSSQDQSTAGLPKRQKHSGGNAFQRERLAERTVSGESPQPHPFYSGVHDFFSSLMPGGTAGQKAESGQPADSSTPAGAESLEKTGKPVTPLPEAELASSPGGRHTPVDWDAGPVDISPELPDGWTSEQLRSSSAKAAFEANWTQAVQREFGAGASPRTIGHAIDISGWLGDQDSEKNRRKLDRAHQHAIIDTLNVEGSSRYLPRDGKTYCNIYAYDLVSAMGGYIPRVWWEEAPLQQIKAGAEVITLKEFKRRRDSGEDLSNVVVPRYGVERDGQIIHQRTVREMNATSIANWMGEYGEQFGWRAASTPDEAQSAANNGRIVVIIAAGKPGHLSVVAAEDEASGRLARRDGDKVTHPLESQAGGRNSSYGVSQNDEGWWEDDRHYDGNMWIFTGQKNSPLQTPEIEGVL